MDRAKTYAELGSALGVSTSQAHKLAREVPLTKGLDGWDVLAARAAVEAHKRRKVAPLVPAVTPATAAPPATAIASSPAPAPEVDALTIARTSLRRAVELLQAADPSNLPRALESVKKSLEELRRTEDGVLKLARAKGELIDLDVAKAVAARVGRRFVNALERLEVRFAGQVELWAFDPAFKALETEARIRAVRAWVLEHTTAARRLEADEIGLMIAAEIEDRV